MAHKTEKYLFDSKVYPSLLYFKDHGLQNEKDLALNATSQLCDLGQAP